MKSLDSLCMPRERWQESCTKCGKYPKATHHEGFGWAIICSSARCSGPELRIRHHGTIGGAWQEWNDRRRAERDASGKKAPGG